MFFGSILLIAQGLCQSGGRMSNSFVYFVLGCELSQLCYTSGVSELRGVAAEFQGVRENRGNKARNQGEMGGCK